MTKLPEIKECEMKNRLHFLQQRKRNCFDILKNFSCDFIRFLKKIKYFILSAKNLS
jgi:intein-encoded DNA endonuclease-like protein